MQKKIVYAGYLIIVTLFFLYYLFPGDAVTSYINYKLSRMSSGIRISIKELKPAFPPGIKLSTPDLLFQNQLLIGADVLKIKPSYFSLFAKNKIFYINGDMYQGIVDSTIRIADISANPKFDAEVSLAGIQISQIPALKKFESYQVSGVASGALQFGNEEVKTGKGSASIAVTDSKVQFTPPLFGIEQIGFNSVNADFDVIGQRVVLKKLVVDGREVSGSASGSIILKTPMNMSTVSITGEVKPHPSFIKQLGNIFPVEMLAKHQSKTGGLPFRITGSLERPNFAFR